MAELATTSNAARPSCTLSVEMVHGEDRPCIGELAGPRSKSDRKPSMVSTRNQLLDERVRLPTSASPLAAAGACVALGV
jgi:hypothetical protein